MPLTNGLLTLHRTIARGMDEGEAPSHWGVGGSYKGMGGLPDAWDGRRVAFDDWLAAIPGLKAVPIGPKGGRPGRPGDLDRWALTDGSSYDPLREVVPDDGGPGATLRTDGGCEYRVRPVAWQRIDLAVKETLLTAGHPRTGWRRAGVTDDSPMFVRLPRIYRVANTGARGREYGSVSIGGMGLGDDVRMVAAGSDGDRRLYEMAIYLPGGDVDAYPLILNDGYGTRLLQAFDAMQDAKGAGEAGA